MDPILIVDDEKDNLEALRRMLRGQYEVSIAESPFEALKLIQNQIFHVIVSDQRMAEMTGVEFLEKAKKLSPMSTRILLTGYTDIESVIDSINRGQIYRYVSKPWEPEEFKMTLRQANEAFVLRKELKDKNESLEKALDELTVLDKAKNRFLSLISHELNTPLTILNSFIELISDRKKELPEDFTKAINSIHGASNRLGEIVKEVIEYVRLQSEPNLIKENVELRELLKSVIAEIKSKADSKEVGLKLSGLERLVLSLDHHKMRTALICLAQDTLKRTPQRTQLDWVLSVSDKGVSIEVIREGEPISEEAFTVLETGQSPMHHHQNLGVGLALCKTIVERHFGTLRIEKRMDKTVVVVNLPR